MADKTENGVRFLNAYASIERSLNQMLCKNDYDQMIITEATTANEFSALIDSNVRKIRILASSNTYYGSNEPVYTDGMITLIDIPAEAGQYKLELEDNGQEKKIVINTVYQPFHLGASSLEGRGFGMDFAGAVHSDCGKERTRHTDR